MANFHSSYLIPSPLSSEACFDIDWRKYGWFSEGAWLMLKCPIGLSTIVQQNTPTNDLNK